MIAVPEVVEQIVKRSPFLEDALKSKILNLSAFAKVIQPQIQEKLFKDIQIGAIVMALKRLEEKLQKGKVTPSSTPQIKEITVRSNLVECTFYNSDQLLPKLEKVLSLLSGQRQSFLVMSQGLTETTIISSQSLESQITKILMGERPKTKFNDLSAITLTLPEEVVNVPGVYYVILKKLAWEGINVIEVISSFTELTIVLNKDQIDQAFSILKTF